MSIAGFNRLVTAPLASVVTPEAAAAVVGAVIDPLSAPETSISVEDNRPSQLGEIGAAWQIPVAEHRTSAVGPAGKSMAEALAQEFHGLTLSEAFRTITPETIIGARESADSYNFALASTENSSTPESHGGTLADTVRAITSKDLSELCEKAKSQEHVQIGKHPSVLGSEALGAAAQSSAERARQLAEDHQRMEEELSRIIEEHMSMRDGHRLAKEELLVMADKEEHLARQVAAWNRSEARLNLLELENKATV